MAAEMLVSNSGHAKSAMFLGVSDLEVPNPVTFVYTVPLSQASPTAKPRASVTPEGTGTQRGACE